MEELLDIAIESTVGYARYLVADITEPSLSSYFYLLILVSWCVYALELIRPWRAEQRPIRAGFWLDAFYMFFNFFLFSLLGFNAASDIAVHLFQRLYQSVGISTLVVIDVSALPVAVQLLGYFVLRDFIQYWVHRALHHVPWLWRLHRAHHSVREMGFAAHLRFHPAETVLYHGLEYIPLAMIGFGIQEFLIVHAVAITIGHLNHANLALPLGPLRYIFNSSRMHIWHHAKQCAGASGVNFGLSLSVWDYLFGTVHWPSSGRDLELGFDGIEDYPTSFVAQLTEPFRQQTPDG